jgi:hypothetical protein
VAAAEKGRDKELLSAVSCVSVLMLMLLLPLLYPLVGIMKRLVLLWLVLLMQLQVLLGFWKGR